MANISKPVDINKIWSATGDILSPSDTKISQGWAVEIPPRQYFNYIDNKQDQAIAHINQHGIAVWDSSTEYQANLSYSKGSDGTIYKALITNTNVNPVGDSTGSWQTAFITSSQLTPVATPTQSRALTANNVYMSPLQVANAFTGTNQLTAVKGFQKLPGGVIIQWASATISIPTDVGATADAAVVFSQPMSTVFSIQLTQGLGMAAEAGEMSYSVIDQSNTGATARFRRVSGSNVSGSETIKADFLVIGMS